MNLLLDTHVLLWALTDSARLSPARRRALVGADKVYASAVSGFEIAFKKSLGKLVAPDGLDQFIAKSGFELLAVTFEHAYIAGTLPLLHRDPFDRMLVAQAQHEGLTLVTYDKALSEYEVPILGV